MEENASTITFSPYPADAAKEPLTEHQEQIDRTGTTKGMQPKERNRNRQEM
jgi:hypothetical protein